jgi:hypothetical protein
VFGVISLGNSFYEISFSSLEYVTVVSMDYLKSIGTLRFFFLLLVALGASNALMLLLAMSRPNIMVMTGAQANTNSSYSAWQA